MFDLIESKTYFTNDKILKICKIDYFLSVSYNRNFPIDRTEVFRNGSAITILLSCTVCSNHVSNRS